MKRRVLFCLTLLVCLARLLPSGATISFEATLSDNPALQCRAKRPFPFDATQFTKKRLSSPPEPRPVDVAAGRPAEDPGVCDAPFLLDQEERFPGLSEAAGGGILPAEAASRVACAIERNVFHPPPVV